MIRLVVAVATGFVVFVVTFALATFSAVSLGLEGAGVAMAVTVSIGLAAVAAMNVLRAYDARAERMLAAQLRPSFDGDFEEEEHAFEPVAEDAGSRDGEVNAEDLAEIDEQEDPDDVEDFGTEVDGDDDPSEDGAEDDAFEGDAAEEDAREHLEPSPVTPTLLDELARIEGPQGTLKHAIATLVFSLFLFFGVESASETFSFVVHLVIVLAIHEAGHFAAMKAFGYRDLRVFFIPFLGAAVSGRKHAASGAQRAIVSLAGPLPGIVLAFGLSLFNGMWWTIDESFLGLMLVLNALNLLPFEPLDGGRFLNVVLYHRHPRAEGVMRAVGAAALIAVAVSGEDWFLGIFGAFFALSLLRATRIGVAAQGLRKRLMPDELATDTIPEERREELAQIVRRDVLANVDVYAQPKVLAQAMHDLWAKAAITAPSTAAAVVLLIFYVATVAGLGLLFAPAFV